MISWRLAAAWVTALVVATVFAWQIVGLADSQVGDTPLAVAPSLTTTPEGEVSTTSTSMGTSTSLGTSTSTPDNEETTTTTPGATTSSSSDTSTPSSPASTSSSSSTSSSTAPESSSTASEQWSLRTITTTGGVAVVRYRTGEVELQAATPVPGFAVEVSDGGPPRVRVEFESEATDVRVEVRWDDGGLDIDVDD